MISASGCVSKELLSCSSRAASWAFISVRIPTLTLTVAPKALASTPGLQVSAPLVLADLPGLGLDVALATGRPDRRGDLGS